MIEQVRDVWTEELTERLTEKLVSDGHTENHWVAWCMMADRLTSQLTDGLASSYCMRLPSWKGG